MCVRPPPPPPHAHGRLSVDSIAGLRAQFDDLLDDLNDPAIFAKFYTWAFDFARDNHRHVGAALAPRVRAPSPAVLIRAARARARADTDMAVNFWHLMLPGRMHRLDAWIAFLEKSKQVRLALPRLVDALTASVACAEDHLA